MKLYDKYIAGAAYDKAARVLEEIVLLSKPDYLFDTEEKEEDFEQNKDYYTEMMNMKNNILANDKQLNQLSSAEMEWLYEIQVAQLPISSLAESWLALNGKPIVEHPIKKLPENFDPYNYSPWGNRGGQNHT